MDCPSHSVAKSTSETFAPEQISWEDLGRCDHFVQFYESEPSLQQSVARFVCAGFPNGEVAVIIATKAHREGIEIEISNAGFDLLKLKSNGRLVMLDAAETLASFMVGQNPCPKLF